MSSPPPPICYLRGTRIQTPEGERGVESLAIGDLVTTADGPAKPVRWVGRRTFRRHGDRWQRKVQPVRIAQGALGGGLPRRDLLVSRKHALLIDRVLVPAKYLVNGSTITLSPQSDTDVLEYFHIELEGHDVVLAEGVAAETLHRDGRNIEDFDNFAEYHRLYPGDAAVATALYAPVLKQTGFNKAVVRFGMGVASLLEQRGPIEEIRDRIAAGAEIEA